MILSIKVQGVHDILFHDYCNKELKIDKKLKKFFAEVKRLGGNILFLDKNQLYAFLDRRDLTFIKILLSLLEASKKLFLTDDFEK